MAAETIATLGPFRVGIEPDKAAAFSAETGCSGQGAPLCYPAVWLAEPSVRTTIADYCAARDAVPVHESQTFEFDNILQVGKNYDLTVAFAEEAEPPRLILTATVATPCGKRAAHIETVMRIVPRSKLGAAA